MKNTQVNVRSCNGELLGILLMEDLKVFTLMYVVVGTLPIQQDQPKQSSMECWHMNRYNNLRNMNPGHEFVV